MKKILGLFIIFLCSILQVKAQYVEYQPVIVDRQGNLVQLPSQQRSSQEESLQTVYAYFVNDKGRFQKIKLKVRKTRSSVTVKQYYDSFLGWMSTSSKAEKVSYSDPDVIQENFEYKVYITGLYKTCYF